MRSLSGLFQTGFDFVVMEDGEEYPNLDIQYFNKPKSSSSQKLLLETISLRKKTRKSWRNEKIIYVSVKNSNSNLIWIPNEWFDPFKACFAVQCGFLGFKKTQPKAAPFLQKMKDRFLSFEKQPWMQGLDVLECDTTLD